MSDMIRLRRKPAIVLRREPFGGVAYVPARDDFFALDPRVYRFLAELVAVDFSGPPFPGWENLVKVGLCVDLDGRALEVPYSGVSFIGDFEELPSISEPLVLNVLVTGRCKLSCAYCHADDLMKRYGESEGPGDLAAIISTAQNLNSIVGVVTGGDPAAAPDRGVAAIEALATSKKIVIDTSGAGDFDALIPAIQATDAHVRISVDGPGRANGPRGGLASFGPAEAALQRCMELGIPTTVQSVVSQRNGQRSVWEDTYEWLAQIGVRNWVIHLAIPAGKNAARGGGSAPLMPSLGTRGELKKFAQTFTRDDRKMDLRITDTAANPNSVLLVAGPGDLFTEGYAKRGKVRLFDAESGRVDQFKALWHYVDQYGHAERYLNYSRWRYGDRDLADLALECRPPEDATLFSRSRVPLVVEMEAKFGIASPELIRTRLEGAGFVQKRTSVQRDEYFDLSDGSLGSQDYAVRVRSADQSHWFAVKGPRLFQASTGSSSRLEFEVPVGELEPARQALLRRGLDVTWVLDKRRETWTRTGVTVEIDEVPVIGQFVEVEAPQGTLQDIVRMLGDALGPAERRNYKELLIEAVRNQPHSETTTLVGATFQDGLLFRGPTAP